MTDIVQGTVLLLAVLALVLCGLVVYLCMMLARIEVVMVRVIKALRGPEVRRDGDGRALQERKER